MAKKDQKPIFKCVILPFQDHVLQNPNRKSSEEESIEGALNLLIPKKIKLSSSKITTFEINENELYAFTRGHGVWRVSLQPVLGHGETVHSQLALFAQELGELDLLVFHRLGDDEGAGLLDVEVGHVQLHLRKLIFFLIVRKCFTESQ